MVLNLFPGKVHVLFNIMEKANIPSMLMHIPSLQELRIFFTEVCMRQRKQAGQCLEELNTAVYHRELLERCL